jgi:hypothetical protein
MGVALDLHGRGATAGVIAGWLVPMVLLGSAVLLFYLARRAWPSAAGQGAGAAWQPVRAG